MNSYTSNSTSYILDSVNKSTPSTMSVVSLLGVQIMNNPAKFTDQYNFEITFECMEQLRNGE